MAELNLDPREKRNLSIILSTVLKYNPRAVSQDGIKKLVSKGYLSFEDAADCIDKISRADEKLVMSVEEEEVQEQSATDDANSNKIDNNLKKLVFNPSILKADIVLNMTKENDNLLYQNYMKAQNILDGTTKEMIEKVGNEFTSMMSHIDTLLDEGEKDQETFDTIRKTNLKIV